MAFGKLQSKCFHGYALLCVSILLPLTEEVCFEVCRRGCIILCATRQYRSCGVDGMDILPMRPYLRRYNGRFSTGWWLVSTENKNARLGPQLGEGLGLAM